MMNIRDSVNLLKSWRLLVFALLVALCGLEWRTIRLMRGEMSQLRSNVDVEATRYALSQLSDDRRDEFHRLVIWLDEFYRSKDGVQQPGGVCTDNHLDSTAIERLLDPYLRARISGDSEEAARQKVVAAIKATPEWRAKHP